MAWTLMQQKAIQTRGTNILVSAGAGSGKTAVLSERVLEYCLAGNDIRRLLVLTFTNAAAAEMKERIRKKLLEHQLVEQAGFIDRAAITTFDAYSLSLVKKYYYALDVDKDVSIIDQTLLEVTKKTLLDSYFDELYEQKDEAFLTLLTKYAKQNDDGIKKMVLDIVAGLELLVDEEQYEKEYANSFGSDAFLRQLTTQYEKLVLSKLQKLASKIEYLNGLCTDAYDEKLGQSLDTIITKINQIRNYNDLYAQINTFVLPRVSSKSSELVKQEKARCGEEIKKFTESYCSKYQTLEEAFEELKGIQPEIKTLLTIAREIRRRVISYEYEMMAFDYMDIAKMAIRLVTTNQQIHNEISNQLNEILIDEYQDTSDIQEAFIQAISRNNCYMVGDIKQSIYRFRNANPYIFKKKYEEYGKEQNGIKIDLTHNFRSRKEVINNINNIFESLMTNDCGDADYSLSHRMHFGQLDYEKNKSDASFDMEILAYDSDEHFTDEEKEAFICGRRIQKLMKEAPLCLGKEGYRSVRYSDIAILIDKTRSFVTFKKIFEYLQIPLVIEADLDLNASILPKLISNILLILVHLKNNVLDPAYHHALGSIARSFVGGYLDTEVYKLVHHQLENELTSKLTHLLEVSKSVPLDELFDEMVQTFHIYERLPLIGDVENSCVVLEYLSNLFVTMKNSKMGLEEASNFLSEAFESGIALKYQLANANTDSVHLMTIHKSKGLEFAYCFFPMLSSSFNMEDMKRTYGMSGQYGIYIPYSDEANSNTIIKALADEETKKADISERVRLFYVALTRAREKIFLISNDEEYREHRLEKENYGSFNHMLRSLRFLDECRQKMDPEEIGLTKNYKLPQSLHQLPQGKTINYPVEDYLGQRVGKKAISKELKELMTPNLLRTIELGKEFHECLEVLDLAHPDVDGLPIRDSMKKTLKNILSHPIFQTIGEAETYHEHEFYFEDYHGIIDLLVVYKDHIDIIDYKLANVDSEEYQRQLSIYKSYVASISNLEIHCYLLSILRKQIKQIF